MHTPMNKKQGFTGSYAMLKPKLSVLATSLLLCTPVLLMSACGKQGPAAQGGPNGMPPPEVNVVTVQSRDLPIDYEYVGQTAGIRETEVRARITGILDKRVYEEGAKVKAGQVLFQIDPGSYQTQLASAEAASGVAEAKLNQAKREFARLAPLAAEKAISQREYDDAKSNLEMAEASYKQVRAQVNEAKLNLSYTRVVAPISGVTGIAAKPNGSLVTPSDSLLTTIVQTDPIYVNFSVTEADFLKMNADVANGKLKLPGKRTNNGSLAFEVRVKQADGSIFPTAGKMIFTSEKVNPNTGGFDARAEIANPEGSLRPGQFVRVMLQGGSRSNAIAIPQRAVIDSPMGKMVFAVSPENKLVPHPVELDGWSRGEWVVTKGLQSGERVLVDGFIKAHDPGMVVTPVPLGGAGNKVLLNPTANPAAGPSTVAASAASASTSASVAASASSGANSKAGH